ncbi:hypothetical protein LTR84_012287 [Exophiala bonariae]|uniref:Uncharacterized protein n=1 Tax=Exophiala bonariae TaxID=1690606 RepID=A0AAV9NJG7_9EURO|nr:hypothetical protein LTR84_012287 [Exophiala bonariae]
MPPKQVANGNNSSSDEKASVWLADALRLTGDEVMLDVAAIAAARGIQVSAVVKQVSRLREKLPGLVIKTNSRGASAVVPAAPGGGRGGKAGKKPAVARDRGAPAAETQEEEDDDDDGEEVEEGKDEEDDGDDDHDDDDDDDEDEEEDEAMDVDEDEAVASEDAARA